MILADTNIWIDHLRSGVPELSDALEDGRVITHPFVIGELACGNIENRAEVLGFLSDLPRSPVADHKEVLAFVEGRSLMRRGIGYVDVHLLAAAMLAGDVRLWTRDRRLAVAAGELELLYRREG